MRGAVDYSKIIIYKIQHHLNPDILYIGSTGNFAERRYAHKTNSKRIMKYNIELYDMIKQNGGWENFKMELIKPYPCKDTFELSMEIERLRHKEEMAAYVKKMSYII